MRPSFENWTWDLNAFQFIHHRLAWETFDPIARFLSNGRLWWAIALGALAFAILRKHKRLALMLLAIGLAVGISDILCFRVFKPHFARPRPCYQVATRYVNRGCGSWNGFPSNHAANGMAAATVVGLMAGPAWGFGAVFLAIVVGFTRIYLGVHFPGDILFGYFIGMLVGSFTTLMCQRAIFPLLQSQEKTS